jgi:hypothetical protein
MPRRFGIATIMILTAVFAALCGVLKILEVRPDVYVGTTVFVSGIVASQALLLKSRDPRLASIIAGAMMFPPICFMGLFLRHRLPRYWTGDDAACLFGATLLLLPMGGLLGYLVGSAIAAVFFVHKEPDDAPPEPPTSDTDTPSPND